MFFTTLNNFTGGPNPPDESSLLNIWPNPADESIELAINAKEPELFEFNLLDLNGKRFISKKEAVWAGDNQFHFNVSEIPDGIYFLHTNGDRSTPLVQKIFVRHGF